MSSTPPPTTHDDEAAIRQLIKTWSIALGARDLDGITANYTSESVLFDAVPPYKTIGKDAIRQLWAHCLPYFPERFVSEHRDISIHVSGDVAWSHCMYHFVVTPPDHPCARTWLRVTVGYRRTAGSWQVLHEHVSLPFNPMDNQAWIIKDPAIVDMPDYGELCK